MPNLSFIATPSRENALTSALYGYLHKTKETANQGEYQVCAKIEDGSETELRAIILLLRHYGVAIIDFPGMPLLTVEEESKVTKYHSEHHLFHN